MSFFDDHEDEIVYGWARDDADGGPYSRARKITCKFCGQSGLEWGATLQPRKWVLLSSRTMNPHECKARGPASPGEFPTI